MTTAHAAVARPLWVLQQNRRDQALLATLARELDRLGLSWIAVPVVDHTPPGLPATAHDRPTRA